LPGDAWISGCRAGSDNANCPDDIGPDFDFSASPALVTTNNGRELIVVPQKSGVAYALDPDNAGALVWEHRVGPGSAVGGVWGTALGDGLAYVAVGGYFSPASGGIHGIDLETGKARWIAAAVTADDLFCSNVQGCGPTQSAAVTAVPGAVFSGAQDGGMRAYSAETGEVLWQFNANRSFVTVNDVEAKGGSFDGSGPVIANGMLYMLSGNAGFVGMPGNVLLAFELESGSD
jgi:polyvinyl alcohol dehydrogenase (cytochrome)